MNDGSPWDPIWMQIDLHFASGFDGLEGDDVRAFQTTRFEQELDVQVIMLDVPPFAFGRD